MLLVTLEICPTYLFWRFGGLYTYFDHFEHTCVVFWVEQDLVLQILSLLASLDSWCLLHYTTLRRLVFFLGLRLSALGALDKFIFMTLLCGLLQRHFNVFIIYLI